MADCSLSNILDNIFWNNNNIDQKAEIHKWLEEWVFKYDCAGKTFNLPPEVPKDSLNFIHRGIKALYGQSVYLYDEAFIDQLLQYIQEAYSINSSSEHLKNCINKLNKLRQNFDLNNCDWLYRYERYPNIEKSKTAFEEYGRVLFAHHHRKKIPFVFQMGLLYYFQYKIEEKMKKKGEEGEEEEKKKKEVVVLFKEILLDAIDFITYRTNDEKWLEFMHGDLININSALCIHNNFCNEYKQLRCQNKNDDNIDVEVLVNQFAKYLMNIHKNCIFSKLDLDNPQPRLFKYPGVLYYQKNNIDQSHDDNDYYTLILATLNFLIDSDINKVDYILNNLFPHLKEYLFKEEEEEEEETDDDDDDDDDDDYDDVDDDISSNISTSRSI